MKVELSPNELMEIERLLPSKMWLQIQDRIFASQAGKFKTEKVKLKCPYDGPDIIVSGIMLSPMWAITPMINDTRWNGDGTPSFSTTLKNLTHVPSGLAGITSSTKTRILSFWKQLSGDVKDEIETESTKDIVACTEFTEAVKEFNLRNV